MTEDEARTKMCCGPWASPHGVCGGETPRFGSTCIASACMAWRWHADASNPLTERTQHGYCGLAGNPHPLYHLTPNGIQQVA